MYYFIFLFKISPHMGKAILVLAALLVCVASCAAGKLDAAHSRHHRARRDAAVRDCSSDEHYLPPTATDTTERLEAVRALMAADGVEIYIVPTHDPHMSEYVADYYKRRAFITGLKGSAGTAVIMSDKAFVLTDSRYYLQFEMEVDCNWELAKTSVSDIIHGEINTRDQVGLNANTYSHSAYESLKTDVEEMGATLVSVDSDYIDQVWDNGDYERPPLPSDSLDVHTVQFTGASWHEKIDMVRDKMREETGVNLYVISKLDDIAWLLNLRGSDIPYTPVFYSYMMVSFDDIWWYVDLGKVTSDVREHLELDELTAPYIIYLKQYDEIFEDLETQSAASDKVWISMYSSENLYEAITDEDKIISLTVTPVFSMKAKKNEVEQERSRQAHIRDSVALISALHWIEMEVQSGEYVDEMMVVDICRTKRSEQKYFRGESFNTIVGSGPNGAIVHYKVNNETNRQLTTDDMLLLDSGGHYWDGTTDVTRTLHYGTPTEKEKEAYTLVLKGAVELAMTKFLKGTYGQQLDAIARAPLWNVGLAYYHGTGHGVGYYLNIHEGPITISPYASSSAEPLDTGNIITDEPGYYEEGHFGVRLETGLLVVQSQTKHDEADILEFEPLTMVPFENKLINTSLLTQPEIDWINNYYDTIMDTAGEELLNQDNQDDYTWLEGKAQHLSSSVSKRQAFSGLLIGVVIMLNVI